MQVFQNVNESTFRYNNRRYVKNFIVLKLGTSNVAVYNAYDTNLQLMGSTHYSQVMVDGVTFLSQEALMDVLSTIVFAKATGGGTIQSVTGTAVDNTDPQNPIINIPASLTLGETSTTAYRGDRGKIAYDHAQITSGNPHGVTKAMIGLGNVDNTADNSKPVSTAQLAALNLKLNKAANIEFESLVDTSEIYSPNLFSRTGSLFRSSSLQWNEALKKFTIKGTQAVWEASTEVTDGNMGIKALSSALESFKIYDNFGNFFSTGTSGGKKLTRIFTPLRLVSGNSLNETEFLSIECPASTITALKGFTIPNNSIVTIDISNLAVVNTDKNSIIGYAQLSFKNDNGIVTDISRDELRYGRQYSYIKTVPGYVTSTDTRIDASISGSSVTLQFINTTTKTTKVQFEVKNNIAVTPEI